MDEEEEFNPKVLLMFAKPLVGNDVTLGSSSSDMHPGSRGTFTCVRGLLRLSLDSTFRLMLEICSS